MEAQKLPRQRLPEESPPPEGTEILTLPVARLAAENAELRRQLEEETRLRQRAEWRYHHLMRATAQVVWRTEADGSVAQNGGYSCWEAFTGQSTAETDHHGWMQAVHPEDRERIADVWTNALQLRQPAETEMRVRSASGDYHDFLARAVPVHNPDGEVVEWIGTCTDISARKQWERRLHEALQALEHAVEGIARVDGSGRCESVNTAYAAMRGYEVRELEGADWLHAAHPDDRQRLVETYEAALSNGRAERELLGLRRDGSSFPMSAMVVRIAGEDGRGDGHYCFLKDVSERHELQSRLLHAQKMEAVGLLAGGVAHDFNNMLAVINGYSELLLSSLRPESPIRGFAVEIGKASDRATALTRQLLAFSRKQVLAPRVLHLGQRVQRLDQMLRRLIGEDIDLVTHSEPGLACIKADPGQFEQVLINLAVNARDAMPLGGTLTLRLRNEEVEPTRAAAAGVPPGAYVRLEVADTGCGIKPELLQHVFEPFFTTKELGKGTGLGLSTVYGIIRQSGGFLEVRSEVGRGTSFLLYLPQVEEEPESDEELRPVVLPSGNETVLVVEDEPLVRAMVRTILCRCGYEVVVAEDGEQALVVLDSHPGTIHLLLTDVVMPRMSGQELANQVRARRPETAVLFMSGYAEDALQKHGRMDHALLLQKPFTPLLLAQRVRILLDRNAVAPA